MMTRETDVAVDLHDRAAMANAGQGQPLRERPQQRRSDSDSNGTETFYWGTPMSGLARRPSCWPRHPANLVEAIGSVDRGAKTHWYNLVVLAEPR